MSFYWYLVVILNFSSALSSAEYGRIIRSAGSESDSRPSNGSKDFSLCGKSTLASVKMAGLKNSTLGDWPWMAALGYSSNNSSTNLLFRCSGSLISDRFVVTAAHCGQYNGNLTLSVVRIGVVDLNNTVTEGVSPQEIAIEQFISHPNYTDDPIANDIAVLRLENPVTFNENVRPICILSGSQYKLNKFYARKLPYIVGWGPIDLRGQSQINLQHNGIETIGIVRCARKYSNQKSVLIDDRVLCTKKCRRNYCPIDAGGPLIIPRAQDNKWYLAGVASFGITYAVPNYPGVYTRVANFDDWIKSTAGL